MNRTAFNEALDLRPDVLPELGNVIVLFFDLDRFKEVNDNLGHKIGDQLLVEVAGRAGAVLNDARAFARLGGDEFAAIASGRISGSMPLRDPAESSVERIAGKLTWRNPAERD